MEWITNSLVVTRLEKNDLHSRIAAHCIETFCRLPEDNVLQLPNPLILNSGIPDLPSQIHSKISSDVQYAALYGFLHVVEIENPSTELFSKLETFFAGSAIKWLEVLSLLGATKNALVELDKVTVWYKSQSRQLQDHNLKESLLRLLMQCRRFTYQFHGVISVSAGHITHSALSHSPDADWRMRYCGRSTEHLPTVRGRASAWDSLLTIRGHTGWVCWVSFLPDGSRVVSGSWDGTARIWDAVTGDELMIFRGHTQRVCTVSFPSDGSRLASASEDQTVRIWDALTGDELKVLRGHTEQVWSVSFSPDGSKVASSSQDSTVRIWDAVAGNELKVLRGHTMSIGSVSFSSDGSRLASGSDDRTGTPGSSGQSRSHPMDPG
ncbi:WD40-repeat-containing domain protein [Cantharellus anzutake]|uniref:WD40-repeat-containing domain protein n=1 Tax=Cantharellus anzutake TaxID=1750568 RepID=UPI001907D519|nr:WD40-repeat-containing domain protein [Cantharellus anzutake]KAF8344352.1 WD40-repeat-containing domain protein [Cantharellus anzutake]